MAVERQRPSRRAVLKGAAMAAALPGALATRVLAQAPAAEAITPPLVEAAKKEGKVSFYTAMDIPVAERLAKTFEARFSGVGVRVERSGSERIYQRIEQERSSNIFAVDVVNSADAAHFIVWKRNAWLAPYLPEEAAQPIPGRVSRSRWRASDHAYLAVLARLQHQSCEGRGGPQELTPTCSTPSGRAGSSRRTPPTPAPS